jgi:hypothetical protein
VQVVDRMVLALDAGEVDDLVSELLDPVLADVAVVARGELA